MQTWKRLSQYVGSRADCVWVSYPRAVLYAVDVELHRDVKTVQEVPAKDQCVHWCVDRMDPAYTKINESANMPIQVLTKTILRVDVKMFAAVDKSLSSLSCISKTQLQNIVYKNPKNVYLYKP